MDPHAERDDFERAVSSDESLNRDDRVRVVKSGACEENFPMRVLAMDDFLSLERMRPFEELESALVGVERGMAVLFLSHQWLSRAHPDPEGIQLSRIQAVFRTLIEGGGPDLIEDWEHFSAGVSKGMCGTARELEGRWMKGRRRSWQGSEVEQFQDYIREGFVWLDYSSIPQGYAPSAVANRSLAVSSIPHYLERADLFFVVAPSANHLDSQEECDFKSWRRRGWCRLEEWGRFLSQKAAAPGPLIITDSPQLKTYGPMDFMLAFSGKPRFGPLQGDFTCCQMLHEIESTHGKIGIPCDKEQISSVIKALWDRRLKTLREAGHVVMQNCHCMYIEPLLFPNEADDSIRNAHSIEEFLSRSMRTDVSEELCGTTAWHLAATVGNMSILRQLSSNPAFAPGVCSNGDAGALLLSHAAIGGNHEVIEWVLASGAVPPSEVNVAVGKLGITCLDRAAKCGFPEVVLALVRHKADVNSTRADGSTPLMGAVVNGHLQCCVELLAHRADINAQDSAGHTALQLADEPFAILGSSEDKERIAALLKQHPTLNLPGRELNRKMA